MGRNTALSTFILLLVLFYTGCGKKDEEHNKVIKQGEFQWKESISAENIPDFPVKAFLNGKAVQINYVSFESWRGSRDNVLNFSSIKPAQQCGFIDNYQGVQVLNEGNPIGSGIWAKLKFDEYPGSYHVFYKYMSSDQTGYKSDCDWNCALEIDNISPKIVTGKIAVCFNDKDKSWIAGKFEAAVCNN